MPRYRVFPKVIGISTLHGKTDTPLGTLHVLENYDGSDDERRGWAVLLERRNCLELQEIFVKPEFRRQGIASTLVRKIDGLRGKKPLVSAVYSIDAELGAEAASRLTKQLKLCLCDAAVPWARWIARPERTLWRSRSKRSRH
jgi:GNAT superfamily N-acetyltransferase